MDKYKHNRSEKNNVETTRSTINLKNKPKKKKKPKKEKKKVRSEWKFNEDVDDIEATKSTIVLISDPKKKKRKKPKKGKKKLFFNKRSSEENYSNNYQVFAIRLKSYIPKLIEILKYEFKKKKWKLKKFPKRLNFVKNNIHGNDVSLLVSIVKATPIALSDLWKEPKYDTILKIYNFVIYPKKNPRSNIPDLFTKALKLMNDNIPKSLRSQILGKWDFLNWNKCKYYHSRDRNEALKNAVKYLNEDILTESFREDKDLKYNEAPTYTILWELRKDFLSALERRGFKYNKVVAKANLQIKPGKWDSLNWNWDPNNPPGYKIPFPRPYKDAVKFAARYLTKNILSKDYKKK